jgi:predicted PolB exonuclease-like 3'-5' exonuclease
MELIIDIETVAVEKNLENLSDELKKHWAHKATLLKFEESTTEIEEKFALKAGIYAEFGKIICIGLGIIDNTHKQIRIKKIANHNEEALLQEFLSIICKLELESKTEIIFCGHNIKEFDLPYICRRATIHQLALPKALRLSGLKPWQVPHQDTLDMWRFGDYKHYTSLDLLATILKVPSSKTDIDGSEVNRVYWEEGSLERIADYCARDIFTTALVYLKLQQKNIEGFEAVNV